MSRRSRAKSKAKSGGLKLGKIIFPFVREATTPISFLEQISAKDRLVMGSAFDTAPIGQKLKIMSNIVTGRITGINLFGNEYQAPQTFKLENAINKWSKGGVGGILYSVLGKRINKAVGQNVIPATSQIGQLGKRAMLGGALGGVFDDPVTTVTQNTRQGTRGLESRLGNSQGMSNQSRPMVLYGNSNEGSGFD